MASNDKLWFEMGVRDDVTKVLDKLIGKANDLQKALSISGKDPIIPGFKESYDNITKLEVAIEKIRGSIRSVRTAKMSVTDPKDIANLNKILSKLEEMRSRVKAFISEARKNPKSIMNDGVADAFLSGIGFDTAIAQATNRAKGYEVALKNNTRAAKESAQVNESLIKTYNEISSSGKNVNVVLTQMQQQFASFTSLYGIERLLKSVITIGGQFEFQHIALQNILGDVQQANTLFGQLQTLAIESPKTFMELTSYTKQLSAYQIPYEELYDTTKRLADLSTGLGVDMSRLILAYGQVRSAAVLRGQELRQFTEAGIPLVQKLSEEFTKLNGKVTTTGDVFELISKRAVPFEMVKKILWDMTSEGGQFFNMQAELADTLYGKWQKLQDQWQITLGHIADGEKSSGKFLKTTLEGFVKLVSLFDTLLPLFSMFAVGKMSMGIFEKGKGVYNKYTGRTAANNWQIAKEKEALRLEKERLIYGRQLTAEEQKLVKYKNQLVATDMRLLVLQGEINEKQLAQLANAGELNRLEFYRFIRAQGYTLEQYKQIKNGNLQMLQGGGSFIGNLLKGGWNMMGGWFGMITTSIGLIMSLQSNASQKAEEATNAAKGAADNILKELKDANTIYNELSNKPPKTTEEKAASINRMAEALKQVNAYTPELERNLEKASDSEKYVILHKRLEGVASKYLEMKDNVEAYIEAANRVGEGNWFTRMFNDPMLEDLKGLATANREKKVAKAMADRMGAALKKELKAMLQDSGEWKDIQDSWSWDRIYRNLKETGKSDFYVRLGRKKGNTTDKEEKEYWEELINLSQKYRESLYKVKDARDEVDSQMPESVEYWYMALQEKASLNNVILKNLGKEGREEDVRKVDQWINDIVGSMELDPETTQMVREKILEKLPKDLKARIEALPALNKSNLSKWQEELQRYFNDNSLNVPIDVQTSLEKVEKQLQEKKKEFQEQMDRGKGILIRFGADFSNLEASIEALKKKYPFLSFFLNKAKEDYTEGSSGVEKIDKAGKDLGLNVNGKTKKSGNGSKKDTELEKAQTRLEEIKKFYAEYKKYREVYGSEKAQSLVEEIFGMKPGEGDKIVKDYKSSIKKILDSLPDNGSEARKKFKLGGNQLLGDVDLDKAKQQADYVLKDVQEYLSRQTEQWNLYRTLFEKTGDRDFAMNAFRDGMVWDDLSRQFADDLRVAIEGAGKNLNVNKLLGMTEEQAKEALKGVEGGYALWKKTSDLVRKNYNKALNDGVAAMEKQYDITEKIRIERERIAELERQRDNTTDPAVRRSLSAEILNRQKNLDNQEYEKFKQSSEYVQFFGSILTMADDTMERTAQTIRDRLIVELSRGNISAHQYAKALKDVSTQLEKGRTAFKGPKGAFLDGGLKGLVEYREQESANAARRVEEARKELEELQKRRERGEEISKIDEESAKARLEMALQMLGNTNKLSIAMQNFASFAAKAGKALAIIQGAFNGFAQVGQSIAETLRAFGDDSTASDWQTMSDSFNAMTQAISPLQDVIQNAMNGNVSGIISSVISAPVKMITGPITAFAKMHDAALQEEIEASQARQKEMETLFENVEKVLGRVLGGVYEFSRSENSKTFRDEFNKEAIKRIAYDSIYQRYKDSRDLNSITGRILKGIAGSDATVGYFKTAAETQEYYDMQRALLAAQQQELQRQLSAEEDKKDSDANAIADYKQQIKDLGDQIQYFAMDMAKALYDIDLQSWASELTDAVVSAWENGEDAAEAYTNKVKSLMKDLTKNILTKKVMEKAFEQAGIDSIITRMMDATSGKLDYTLIPELSKALAKAGQDSTDIITRVLDEMERQGYIDKGEGSGGGSVTSGIKAITENTADLLASYLNAIRADVSVNRGTLQQILLAVQSQAQMPVIAQAQLQQLQSISANTGRNAQAAEDILRLLNLATVDASHGFHVN